MKHITLTSTPSMLGCVSIASKLPPVAANQGPYAGRTILTHSVRVFRLDGLGFFVTAPYVWVKVPLLIQSKTR